jgi:hypothetical protein
MATHLYGRLGVGKNQGVVTTEYPLITPSNDIVHLLADVCLVINPHTTAGQKARKGGLTFFSLRGFGELPPASGTPAWLFEENTTNTHDCILINAVGERVLNTAGETERSVVELQGRLRRVVWAVEHEYTLVLTYHTKWPEDGSLVERDYRSILLPEAALLCDSVVQFAPETRLFYLRPNPDNLRNPDRVAIRQINDGHNTTIAKATPDAFIKPQPDLAVLWSVDPGSGLGRLENCSPPLQTLNSVPPGITGEFIIGADPCMAVTNVGVALNFSNDCRACCDCDDYAQAGAALDAADYRYRQLAILVEDFRADFVPTVEKWNAAVVCANSRVLSLQFSQRLCPTLAVAIGYCNTSDDCAENVVFALSLTGGTPLINEAKRVVRPNKFIEATVGSEGIVVRIKDVPSGTKETVLLTLSFPQLAAAERPLITGILRAAVDGQPLLFDGRLVQANAEIALRCPTSDDDFINL